MYEEYFGLAEKPFNLTPDPKYIYRSETHANAFELLQYAIRRREGFIVVTGDIGTGKTTLCRALLERVDKEVFTALVLNPFVSEEDLLIQILQDFGIVSREEVRRGRLAGLGKQELIDLLYDFLLSLVPLQRPDKSDHGTLPAVGTGETLSASKGLERDPTTGRFLRSRSSEARRDGLLVRRGRPRAGAVVVIDEAQNLPLKTLEQIRVLSNLETEKEKLLQIVLVGQLNLQTLLRSPELRQLDQRISIRYELKPLTREEVAAYVNHRLTVAAGGGPAVSFAPKALDRVYHYSRGVPRLINLLCDHALLGGFATRTSRIQPDMISGAAISLQVKPPATGWLASLLARFPRFQRRSTAAAGGVAAVLVLVLGGAAGSLAYHLRSPLPAAAAPSQWPMAPVFRPLPPPPDPPGQGQTSDLTGQVRHDMAQPGQSQPHPSDMLRFNQ